MVGKVVTLLFTCLISFFIGDVADKRPANDKASGEIEVKDKFSLAGTTWIYNKDLEDDAFFGLKYQEYRIRFLDNMRFEISADFYAIGEYYSHKIAFFSNFIIARGIYNFDNKEKTGGIKSSTFLLSKYYIDADVITVFQASPIDEESKMVLTSVYTDIAYFLYHERKYFRRQLLHIGESFPFDLEKISEAEFEVGNDVLILGDIKWARKIEMLHGNNL